MLLSIFVVAKRSCLARFLDISKSNQRVWTVLCETLLSEFGRKFENVERTTSITVGRFSSQSEAERVLLKTALAELATLGEALRKVARTPQGFDANFVGLTEEGAELACRRLQARNTSCRVLGPS